jgi:hypothetical protein
MIECDTVSFSRKAGYMTVYISMYSHYSTPIQVQNQDMQTCIYSSRLLLYKNL